MNSCFSWRRDYCKLSVFHYHQCPAWAEEHRRTLSVAVDNRNSPSRLSSYVACLSIVVSVSLEQRRRTGRSQCVGTDDVAYSTNTKDHQFGFSTVNKSKSRHVRTQYCWKRHLNVLSMWEFALAAPETSGPRCNKFCMDSNLPKKKKDYILPARYAYDQTPSEGCNWEGYLHMFQMQRAFAAEYVGSVDQLLPAKSWRLTYKTDWHQVLCGNIEKGNHCLRFREGLEIKRIVSV